MTFHELLILALSRFVVVFARNGHAIECVLKSGELTEFEGEGNTPDGALGRACDKWRERLETELVISERAQGATKTLLEKLRASR